jgi:hypothetical protein
LYALCDALQQQCVDGAKNHDGATNWPDFNNLHMNHDMIVRRHIATVAGTSACLLPFRIGIGTVNT